LSASSVVAELLAMADPEWVGAVWDSHHPHRMGERPADVYANLGRRILLAQVKDARRRPDGDWELVLLGEGEVPVREMLGLLASGGYRDLTRPSRTARHARTAESDEPRPAGAIDGATGPWRTWWC
jgi:sugar phosphate isomerase/epimerase